MSGNNGPLTKSGHTAKGQGQDSSAVLGLHVTPQETAAYQDERDALIIAREGVRPYPYADAKGIPSIGVGMNLQTEKNFAIVLHDLGLDDKLTAAQKKELQSVMLKSYDPGSGPQNAAEHAIDAMMEKFHHQNPKIPAHLAYADDTDLRERLSTTLKNYMPHDHPSPFAGAPEVEKNPALRAADEAEAKALGMDVLTVAQRDQLRVVNSASYSDTTMAMLAINAKMKELHQQNPAIPESIPGSGVAKMRAQLDATVRDDYEKRVDNWLSVPESSERAVLVSMAYNGYINTGAGAHGPVYSAGALREALIEGNAEHARSRIAHVMGHKPELVAALKEFGVEHKHVGTVPPDPQTLGPVAGGNVEQVYKAKVGGDVVGALIQNIVAGEQAGKSSMLDILLLQPSSTPGRDASIYAEAGTAPLRR